MVSKTEQPESSFELSPDTQYCYIQIPNTGNIDLQKPHDYTYDGIEYGNSGIKDISGALSTNEGGAQSPGRFLEENSFLLVIPQDLITESNVTIRAEDGTKLLCNLTPDMVVALISTDNSKKIATDMAAETFPGAKVFSLEEWAKFKNPNEIVGGLTEITP